MPVRRSPDPRRVVVIVVASLAFVVAVAVVTTLFSGFDALGQRTAVVHFDGTVSFADKVKIQHDCADPPTIKAMPTESKGPAAEIRYRVDKASDGDIAVLSKCLKGHQGVVGIQLSDLTLG